MGFKFQHANIMAYATSRSSCPPRMRSQDLMELLTSFSVDVETCMCTEETTTFRLGRISRAAMRAVSKLSVEVDLQDRDTLPAAVGENILQELRSELSDFALFALSVGAWSEMREIARKITSDQWLGHLLVLTPEQEMSNHNFEVLDPIPAFSEALHAASAWPGFVFWTSTGASAFVPLEDLDRLLYELKRVQTRDRSEQGNHSGGTGAGAYDWALRGSRRPYRNKHRRLHHLSDLHLGTREASENQPLLEAELRNVVRFVDRVVITGDLFDTPSKKYATFFTTFRNTLTHLAGGREPISITGNHDQRMMGNFGDSYKQVALIGSTKIVVDDKAMMVFICFNSSESGRFARGRISTAQFNLLGAEYQTLLTARPELDDYLPIVLVHHHPFSFDVQAETWVQRTLVSFGLREEMFLELVNAKELHRWCLDWNVRTILHGHKHKARYVVREIDNGTHRMELTAIGCGTSLGAEGYPLSYTMLEWMPDSQRWIATFYESVNGGAFREVVISISPPNAKNSG